LLTLPGEVEPKEFVAFSPCGEYIIKLDSSNHFKMFHIDNKLEEVALLNQSDTVLSIDNIYDYEWIKLERRRLEHFMEPFLFRFDPNQTSLNVNTDGNNQSAVEQTTIKMESPINLLVLYLREESGGYSLLLYLNGKLPFLKLNSRDLITKFTLKKDLYAHLDHYVKALNIAPILDNLKGSTSDIVKSWNDFFSNPTFSKLEHLNIFQLIATRLNYITMDIFASASDTYYSKLLTSLTHIIERIDNQFFLIITYIEYLISNLSDINLDNHYSEVTDIYYHWKTQVCDNVKSILACLSDIQSQKVNTFQNVQNNFSFYRFEKLEGVIHGIEQTILTSRYFAIANTEKNDQLYKTNHRYCKNTADYYFQVSDGTLYIFQDGEEQPFQVICGLADDDVDELYHLKEGQFIAKSPHTVLYVYDHSIQKYIQFEEPISNFSISTHRNLFAVCLTSSDRTFSVYEI